MKLDLNRRENSATLPHHTTIVCRMTNNDEWLLDLDGLNCWGTTEVMSGLMAKIIAEMVNAGYRDEVEAAYMEAIAATGVTLTRRDIDRIIREPMTS